MVVVRQLDASSIQPEGEFCEPLRVRGQPGLGVGYELDAIAAAVIGGTSLSAGGIGTVAGTIVGALIIGVLNNTLDLMNVSAFWQQIVKGCIIVGAVILDQLKNRGGK